MFSSHLAIVGIDRDNANVGIRGGQWSLVTIVVTSGGHHQPFTTLSLLQKTTQQTYFVIVRLQDRMEIDNLTSKNLHSSRKLLLLFIFPRPCGQMMSWLRLPILVLSPAPALTRPVCMEPEIIKFVPTNIGPWL